MTTLSTARRISRAKLSDLIDTLDAENSTHRKAGTSMTEARYEDWLREHNILDQAWSEREKVEH